MYTIKPFLKRKLTQDEIIKLFLAIINYCEEANISALDAILNLLHNKVNVLQSMIHVVMGSELTPELLQLDNERDEYTVGLNYYNEFALRHYDPQKRRAAVEIETVLNTTSYKGIYKNAYDRETNKITNLIEELNNHSEAIAILGIGDYVQALDNANQAFDAMYQKRMKKTARTYTSTEIRQARSEMEQTYELLRSKLITLAIEAELSGNTTLTPVSGGTGGMGGGSGTGMGGTGTGMGGGTTSNQPLPHSYEELFSYINNHITHAVDAAEARLAAQRDNGDENGNSSNNNSSDNGENNGENTGEGGTDNNGGENGGENTNTDNTDPNQGDDNTPSANA